MTTNELKCPVCGERMKQIQHLDAFYCINKICTEYDTTKISNQVKEMSVLIQLRIDKAKAAAVQEERERVVKWLDGQMLTDVSGLYNRGYDEALVDVKIYLEEQ